MKQVPSFLIVLSFLLLSTACSGIKYLTVETHEPAQVTLPTNVLSIVIANNVVQQPDDVGHDITPLGRKQAERAKASSDSIAIIYTEALAQFLDEEDYFFRVFYYHSPLREDTHFFQEQPISLDRMNEIRQETGADAIISLDKLIIETDKREFFRQQGYMYSVMRGKIHSLLRVYMPTMEGKIPAVQYNDSLRWEGFDIQDGNAYADAMIPSREEVMKILAVRAAEKMTNVFAPHWEMQDRWYYISASSLMRRGEAFAKEARWGEAIEKWEAYYNARSNKGDKAKAANNIALAHEMMGDMEEAYKWVNLANDLFVEHTGSNSLESRRSLIYKKEIERRRDNSIRLDMRD